MNQSKTNNIEVDFRDFMTWIRNGFKAILRFFFGVLSFYKKYWIVFTVLFILGAVGGYFIEQKLQLGKPQKQEIIITPKYNSTAFIYSFVNNFQYKLTDSTFLKQVGLSFADVQYVEEVNIKPIIQTKDILDGLYETDENQLFYANFFKTFTNETLADESNINFYELHKLTLSFSNDSDKNQKVSKQILTYLKNNPYYEKFITLFLEHTKYSLEKNERTLKFIDQYLAGVNSNPISSQKETVVIADESKVTTLASLVEQKSDVVKEINDQKKIIELNTQPFDIVAYNDVASYSKKIHKRIIILLPLFICIFATIVLLIRGYGKDIRKYAFNE